MMDARSSPAPARQRPSQHKSCKAAVSKVLTCPGKRSKTVLLAESSRHFPFQPVSARIYFHKHACCGNKSRSTSTAPQNAATEPPVLLRWGYFTPEAFHRLQAAHIPLRDTNTTRGMRQQPAPEVQQLRAHTYGADTVSKFQPCPRSNVCGAVPSAPSPARARAGGGKARGNLVCTQAFGQKAEQLV